jgi:hypothetical protein
MLQKATTHRDLLVSLGMSASLLDDLAAALGEFEKTLEATRSGRRDHVGASADLDAVATEIAEQVFDCSTAWCAIGSGTTPS